MSSASASAPSTPSADWIEPTIEEYEADPTGPCSFWCCARPQPDKSLHPPVSTRERWSWFMYDWSNSATSSVAISGFLPILIQEACNAAAGFPRICPNLVTNLADVDLVFPGKNYKAMYFLKETNPLLLPSQSCIDYVGGSVCPGFPGSSDNCLNWPTGDVYPLRMTTLDGTSWYPPAYTNAMNSLATGLNVLFFITLSGLADYGPYRKKMFTFLSVLGCALMVLCLVVRGNTWQFGGFLLVSINIAYSTSYVFYNAWLPLLAANDPKTLKAPPTTRNTVFMDVMNDMSQKGYYMGYIGSVVCLIICVIIVTVLSGDEESMLAYSICTAVAGVWWFSFSLIPFRLLRERPGPPLPPGENQFILPWKRLYQSILSVRSLPNAFKFLCCWFIYSDGMNTISSVAVIYANTSVSWQGFSKGLGIAVLLVVTPLVAALGGIFFNFLLTRRYLTAKTVIAANIFLMSAVPAYGLLGFAHPLLGYRRYWELYIGALLYGFNLGSLQSCSRSIFGSFIPEGMEANMYALFNITDIGSSCIGPAIVASVLNSTGSIRYAFIYPIFSLLLPIPFLYFINCEQGEQQARDYAKTQKTAGLKMRGALSSVEEEKEVSSLLISAENTAVASAPLINQTTATAKTSPEE
jgi:MFS transporter, UMF1 family